ncbi:T9SS type A sorting domain-containing protein [Lacinutrix sp. WUR7]|uniref:T9SS type A sorting domain-containing protein n=1 Tax=Lacinutrix sp. WUR7 TaxID=2653681 RepID=UPI00193C96A7|nr:T9SS type A sorting domain-containing protein [Lacinutrix sp. WUR7]QRM88373.1 T9SS type A sorting domain-containing protein [Lacinutrix sp. WUR7]
MKKNYNLKKAILKSIRVFCVLLLFSYSAIAQNINFTIDTAQDDGVSITETLMVGSDTYVLLIDVPGSGAETLFELSTGDWAFYYGSGGANANTFTLTLTRNGIPTNFNLNGIDYDTVETGFISILNQDDTEISINQQYVVGSGAINITNPANAADISAFKIIQPDFSDNTDFAFHNINVSIVEACVPPAGTANFVSQDCGAGTFMADVNITALGSGTPSIFDGTTTTAVTATGVYNFGPYPTGTPVNFTLQHGSDAFCNVDLGAVTDTCPPPCLPPAGTVMLNSQDCVAGTFLVDVNVTDLGSGGSPVIYDGTTSSPVTATGITTLGPYAAGTIIPITLLHGSDSTCNVDLGIVKDTCNEIIFTIDTAVDNGTNITETIVVGADTFVLTVDHSGSEALLGVVGNPSDLFFYHSTTNPLDPFVLSVTRNGFPANFTLNGIDYDAAGTGSIYVRNQDDQVISAYTSYDAGSSGALNFTNVLNGVNISSFKIGTNNTDDLNLFGFHNISIDIEEGCVPPVGTATFVSQDCGAGTFLAQVNVTDLGGGTPSIFDGTTTTPVTAIGDYDFGPYPTGTPVNFTLQHGTDITCNVDLGAVTDTCPPPCSPAAGTAQLDTPFQDCDAGTFYAVINITDLGSGGSPVLFDGTNSIPITGTGTFGVGTYPIGTPVTFTLQHGVDPTCDVVIGTVSNTCDEVIFTIDTAVDDDTLNIITETIVKDGDTYVLTIAHSGDEDLEELPGLPGDFVFFHSFGDPLNPHVLSITRNGFPTNFTLKGMDYDALNPGTILVTNNDDLEISSPTSYPLGSGAIAITSVLNATDISSFNISAPVSGELNSFGFHNIKVDIVDTCAAGAATATLGTQDCANSGFYVDVNVTDVGNGSPVIFDGTASTTVTTTGTYELGPYASGTSINFTLQHGNDVACDVDLGAVTFTCPAPANDLCTGTIAVTCGETVTGSTVSATDSGGNPSNDVYYSFMSATLTDVNLSLCGSDYDTAFRIFDDCLQSNLIAFNDDSEACSGDQSVLTFTAQPNITYFIMIEGYDDDDGDYEMVVDCITSVPSPGNDLCANPTSLNLGVTLTGQTTAGATDSTVGEDDDTECDSYTFKADVWYTFQGPASGQATIATVITDTSDQANVAVYSSLDCSQLDVDIIACSAYNGGETVALTGLVPSATYYVRVWSDGVAGPPVSPITSGRFEGGFSITVTDSTLSIPGIEDEQLFSYYPNPVKGLLNITAKKEMSKIAVFNMLGQTVLTEIPNTTTRSLDMSNLQTGAYFVSVTIGTVTKTIRVIKE